MLEREHLRSNATASEVLEAARQNGIDDLADVRLAVLETSGKLSFITR